MEDSLKHGWTEQQVNMFAKQFFKSDVFDALKFMAPKVRSAMLTEFVMGVATGQQVTILQAWALRLDVATVLNDKYNAEIE